jgi:hypothetical protein
VGLVLSASMTLAGEPASHRVVAEGAAGTTIVARFPPPVLTAGAGPDGRWTEVRVAGAEIPSRLGEPALPEYVVLLAVPVGTVARLEVAPRSETVLWAPAPPPILHWDAETERAVLRAAGTHDLATSDDGVAARLEDLGVVRHVRLARVAVHPVRYRARDASFVVTGEVELRVRFEQAQRDDGPAVRVVDPDAVDLEIGAHLANPSAFAGALAVEPNVGSAADGTSDIPQPEPSVMTAAMIETRGSGLHALRRADLDAAGINVSGIDPATFVLSQRGVEVAIEVVGGADGSFDAPDDVLRFWAWDIGGEETRDNVYRLTGGVRAGLRMATRSAAPRPADPVRADFDAVAHEETNFEFWGTIPESVATPWYWERLSIAQAGVDVSRDYAVALANVESSRGGRLDVRVQSRAETPGANPSHHVRVYLNAHLVGDRTWTGMLAQVIGGDVPSSWIVNGTNTVRVVNVADLGLTVQAELVDWIELAYRDRLVAEGDALQFALEPPGPARPIVEGFGGTNVSVYDVTHRESPVALTGVTVRPSGGKWAAEFSDALTTGTPRVEFVAVRAGAEHRPRTIRADLAPTALRDAAEDGADLLIVAADGFGGAVAPLADHRRAQGLRTVVAEVGEVLEEFNGGIREAEGIRNFVAWAFANYAPPAPTYLLLVGDATFDPADFRGEGDNLVSTHLSRAADIGVAPSDSWLGVVNGDDLLPDIAVGRAGLRLAAEADLFVANLRDYETAPPTGALNTGLLYVADDDDPYFEDVLDELAADYQPPAMTTRRVYLAAYPDTSAGVDQARFDLRASIDAGSLITTYAGHGGRTIWAAEQLWRNADVSALAVTSRLTFNLGLNCINGWFINLDNEPYSLGEEWLRHRARGAVGVWTSAGFGTIINFQRLTDLFYQRVFERKQTRAGWVAWRALIDAYLYRGVPIDYVKHMIYFGDPALELALDSDRDGLLERDELAAGTGPDDTDSDDDGVSDGSEGNWNQDHDGDGRINALDWDADDDGLPDGLERGVTAPLAGTDVGAGHFVADADPVSTTGPLDVDADHGGAPDGAEDRNVNGRVDAGETNPSIGSDDPACAAQPPAELTGLRLAKSGNDVVLTWSSAIGSDPCLLYRVYIATDPGRLDAFSKFDDAGIATREEHRHRGALTDRRPSFYLINGVSLRAGEGTLGHFGR